MRANKVGNKVPYMSVPMAFVTLPKDSTVIQTKRLNIRDVKGGQGFEMYVLACSKKREYKGFQGVSRTVQNWYVAKKIYFAGKPAMDQMLYSGTSERDARHRFADIPYNEMKVKVLDSTTDMRGASKIESKSYTSSTGKVYTSKWAVYKGNGKYAAIAANRSRRYQARQNWRANHAGYNTPGADFIE